MNQKWRVKLATGAPIVALVAIVVLFAFALLWNFARQQDQAFADTTTRLVESALDGRADAVEGIAVDYAIWNDAYVATSRRLDLAWLESNFYSNAVDALFIMDGDGRILYAWTSDATNADILQAEASALPASVSLPALLLSTDANAITLSTRALAGETPALVAVTPISAERDGVLLPRDPTRPARYLAAFDLLSASELSAIGGSLQIEGLHFDAAAGTHERQHPSALHLPLSADGAIGAIAWTRQTPGSDTLAGQVGASIAVLLLLGLAAFALAARLADMHLAANARTEAAEETSRLRAEFVAEVHEQVNGPLNTLVGYAELIEEQTEDLGPEAHNIRNDAQQMRAAAQELSQLLHGAMRHARIDGGRITLVSERVDTSALLEE
ncbi:MAG TPA: CHASE4 domain-containing protein, partial [Verrucomicrobiae bacterium]|nr:CHASE4 domain-containing protein [Verrucomicrobiae bacterium]